MGIPLNIDWRQILLHAFNFLILTGGLYFLLYQPVKEFIAKRERYYRDMDSEAKEKLESARAYEEQTRANLDWVDHEIRENRRKAQAELDVYTADQTWQAKLRAEQILADAKKAAQEERRAILDSADKEILEMAKEAAAKILYSDTQSAFHQFLDTVEGDVDHGQ